MQLDVIIPTYNRQDLLQRTLKSLLAAAVPDGLTVQVSVVDNNSTDDTRQVVLDWQDKFSGRLQYLFERRQGRSFALNHGINSTAGDLVGMIDDDEEIDPQWYATVYDSFKNAEVDFIGGPYNPRWGGECPPWLPMKYVGVIGWIDGGNAVRPYDATYPGILMGGNAVLRREILNRVGRYSTSLGRTDKHLLSGEDNDMYTRLLAEGGRGFYIPSLIIYHYIPVERLTKSYFRRWCFWHGVSMGVLNQKSRPTVKHLWGVPRYLYGEAVRGLWKQVKGCFVRNKNSGSRFADELAVWDVAGFFYGRHFFRPAAAQPQEEDPDVSNGLPSISTPHFSGDNSN